jgi:hypothetical protein
LASVQSRPHSFSRQQLRGKQADLGSSRFSALYMQQPQSLEDQLFPETVWGTLHEGFREGIPPATAAKYSVWGSTNFTLPRANFPTAPQ